MRQTFFLLLGLLSLSLSARPLSRVTRYDENRIPEQWHVTRALQDRWGFLWFATWNGLNRFDGYELVTFKSQAGDGCDMKTDRIRDIRENKQGDIFCKTDDHWYLFSQHSGRFSPVSESENHRLNSEYAHRQAHLIHDNDSLRMELTDRQGSKWLIADNFLLKTSYFDSPVTPFPSSPFKEHIRAFLLDNRHRYWVAGKDQQGTVRLFTQDHRLLGYLTPNGTLSPSPHPFGHPTYCLFQAANGTIWLGSKPDGLFALKEHNGHFSISHFEPAKINGNPTANHVYDIKQDTRGRLWIATLGDGIFCLQNGKLASIHSTRNLKVRYLHLTRDGFLLAATTEGLAIGRIPTHGSVTQMTFHIHRKEAHRASSLSSSAIMHILEDNHHRLFVCTESGGVNQLLSTDLSTPTLLFRHFNSGNGLDNDITLSMAEHEGCIWIVGNNRLMVLHPDNGTVGNYDQSFFHNRYHFSEAHPLLLPDGRWLFGLQDGAFTLQPSILNRNTYTPRLLLTGVQTGQSAMRYAVSRLRSLTLPPEERNLTLQFAALDLRAPENINYAFRLHTGDKWSQLGHNHRLTLPDLAPGNYTLQLKSTNADGIWVNNIYTLRIEVEPRFSETWWAHLLGLLCIISLLGGGIYTWYYIRRIRHLQHETLEAYLALLHANASKTPSSSTLSHVETSPQPAVPSPSPSLSTADDAFMKRVVSFIESHLSDPEANIGDMAEATATSRSGLNRKMKQLLGITPAEFLREARIKHACRLLAETDNSISEVAYSCGFNDPKYFGKIFRSSVGQSPSDYRAGRTAPTDERL